ncbi:hypothetical protein TPA0905_34720 [Streptomyces olivaceus]|nr:hypothetical protein TPA0905_34720 [Streptomyces olivaceus]
MLARFVPGDASCGRRVARDEVSDHWPGRGVRPLAGAECPTAGRGGVSDHWDEPPEWL